MTGVSTVAHLATVFNAFNEPREVHAFCYGVAVGIAATTDHALIRLAILGILFMGGHGLDVPGGPARELQAERQYATAGVLVGIGLDATAEHATAKPT